jgi:hypothetical protein
MFLGALVKFFGIMVFGLVISTAWREDCSLG